MPQLYLRMLSPAEPQDEGFELGVEWRILEDDGTRRGAGVTDYRGLADLADPNAEWLRTPGNVIVIVPSEFVLGVSCAVPGRNLAQIRRALPFVVEEFVATDIEGMHLAHGALRRDQPVRCNLVDMDLLQGWLTCLRTLELQPGFCISEAELLPDEAGVAYALFDGDQVLIKTGDQAATIDRDNLAVVLSSLAEDELRLLNEHPSSLKDQTLPEGLHVAAEPGASATDSTLGYLANRFRDQPGAINLLQGDFAPPRAESAAAGRWRSLAAVAGAWALVAFLGMIVQGIWAGIQADRLTAETEALYRDIFPNDDRIINVRRQTLAHMGERSAGGGVSLLPMVAELGQVLNPRMQLQGFNFVASRGELAVDVMLPSYDDVERIKTALEQRQLAVEIASAETQQDNTIRARMRVRDGAAEGEG